MSVIAVLGTVVLLGGPARADWFPGDPAKYVQLPDLNQNVPVGVISGMDVNATWFGVSNTTQPTPPFIKVLADDFPCTSTGPITGIHVWGSWLNDQMNPNTTFSLSIYANNPGSSANGGYSYPDNTPPSPLWSMAFPPGSYIPLVYKTDDPEQFYDPNTNQIIGADTTAYEYNFNIPQALAFTQTGTLSNPAVYWLSLQAEVPPDPTTGGVDVFGWKTSVDHFGDAAVFADTNLPLSAGGTLIGPAPPPVFWQDMTYPAANPNKGNIDLAFVIATNPVPEPGTLALLAGGGLVLLVGAWRRVRGLLAVAPL